MGQENIGVNLDQGLDAVIVFSLSFKIFSEYDLWILIKRNKHMWGTDIYVCVKFGAA